MRIFSTDNYKHSRTLRNCCALFSVFFYLAFDLLYFPSQALSASNVSLFLPNKGGAISDAVSVRPQANPIEIPPEFGKIDEVYFSSTDHGENIIRHSERSVRRRTDPSDELWRKESQNRDPSPFAGLRMTAKNYRPLTVVYIQDAHDSFEAQGNIAKIIQHLVRDYGVKTVFEEGYEGPVPTDDYFDFIKNPEIKQKISYFLLDRLKIGAAEYAHINRAAATMRCRESAMNCGGDFKLIGADSLKLHRQNLKQYQKAWKVQREIQKDLELLESEFRRLINRDLPPEIKSWLKVYEKQQNGELPYGDYIQRLLELSRQRDNSQHGGHALPAGRGTMERSYHVPLEMQSVIPADSKRGSPIKVRYKAQRSPFGPRFSDKSRRAVRRTFGDDKVNSNAEKDELSRRRENLLAAENYPNLYAFFEAARQQRKGRDTMEKSHHVPLMNIQELFSEVTALENAFIQHALPAGKDKRFIEYFKAIETLKRLSLLKVSQEEYQSAREILKRFDTRKAAELIYSETHKPVLLSKQWEKNIREVFKFYDIVGKRDEAISKALGEYWLDDAQIRNSKFEIRNGSTFAHHSERFGPKDKPKIQNLNIQNKTGTSFEHSELAVLVYGGFHKESIKRILRKKNISYIVVSPKITGSSDRHEKYYRELMTEGYKPLTALPALLHTMLDPDSVFTVTGGRAELQILYDQFRLHENGDTLKQSQSVPVVKAELRLSPTEPSTARLQPAMSLREGREADLPTGQAGFGHPSGSLRMTKATAPRQEMRKDGAELEFTHSILDEWPEEFSVKRFEDLDQETQNQFLVQLGLEKGMMDKEHELIIAYWKGQLAGAAWFLANQKNSDEMVLREIFVLPQYRNSKSFLGVRILKNITGRDMILRHWFNRYFGEDKYIALRLLETSFTYFKKRGIRSIRVPNILYSKPALGLQRKFLDIHRGDSEAWKEIEITGYWNLIFRMYAWQTEYLQEFQSRVPENVWERLWETSDAQPIDRNKNKSSVFSSFHARAELRSWFWFRPALSRSREGDVQDWVNNLKPMPESRRKNIAAKVKARYSQPPFHMTPLDELRRAGYQLGSFSSRGDRWFSRRLFDFFNRIDGDKAQNLIGYLHEFVLKANEKEPTGIPFTFFDLDPHHAFYRTRELSGNLKLGHIIFMNDLVSPDHSKREPVATEFFLVNGVLFAYGTHYLVNDRIGLTFNVYPKARGNGQGLASEIYGIRLMALSQFWPGRELMVPHTQFQFMDEKTQTSALIFYLKLGFLPANADLSAAASLLARRAIGGETIPLKEIGAMLARLGKNYLTRRYSPENPELWNAGMLAVGRVVTINQNLYRVTEFLGEGVFGGIFVGEAKNGNPVFIKTITYKNETDSEFFNNEVKALTYLNARIPEIVPRLYDSVNAVEENAGFLVMEKLSGKDLAEWLSENAKAPVEEKTKLFLHVLQAFTELHKQRFIHHDVKPANIWVTGEEDHPVKILDFAGGSFPGDSDFFEERYKTPERMFGSPAYMPPEMQFESKRAEVWRQPQYDIFSLGILLYEIAAGTFDIRNDQGEMLNILAANVNGEWSDLENGIRKKLPKEWQPYIPVILKAIQKNPEDRYASVEEMIRDIEEIQSRHELRKTTEAVLAPEELVTRISRPENTIPELEAALGVARIFLKAGKLHSFIEQALNQHRIFIGQNALPHFSFKNGQGMEIGGIDILENDESKRLIMAISDKLKSDVNFQKYFPVLYLWMNYHPDILRQYAGWDMEFQISNQSSGPRETYLRGNGFVTDTQHIGETHTRLTFSRPIPDLPQEKPDLLRPLRLPLIRKILDTAEKPLTRRQVHSRILQMGYNLKFLKAAEDIRLHFREHPNLELKVHDADWYGLLVQAVISILDDASEKMSRKSVWEKLVQNEEFAAFTLGCFIRLTRDRDKVKKHPNLRVKRFKRSSFSHLDRRHQAILKILDEAEVKMTPEEILSKLHTMPRWRHVTRSQIYHDVDRVEEIGTHPKLFYMQADKRRKALRVILDHAKKELTISQLHKQLIQNPEFADDSLDDVRHTVNNDKYLKTHPKIKIKKINRPSHNQVKKRRALLKRILDAQTAPITRSQLLKLAIEAGMNITRYTLKNDTKYDDSIKNHPMFDAAERAELRIGDEDVLPDHSFTDLEGMLLENLLSDFPASWPWPKVGSKLKDENGKTYTIREVLAVLNGHHGCNFFATDEKGHWYFIKTVDPVDSDPKEDKIPAHKALANEEGALRYLRQKHYPDMIPYVAKGVDDEGKIRFIVQKINKGLTLFELMKFFSLETLQKTKLNLFEDVLRLMNGLHKRGVVHRDFSPANIYLSSGKRNLRISDFALSYYPGAEDIFASFQDVIGTGRFIPPEMWENKAGSDKEVFKKPSYDVFGLGILFFFFATGRYVLHPDESNLTVERLSFRITQGEDISGAVFAALPDGWKIFHPFLMRALAKDPALRYQNAGEMLNAFREVRKWIGIKDKLAKFIWEASGSMAEGDFAQDKARKIAEHLLVTGVLSGDLIRQSDIARKIWAAKMATEQDKAGMDADWFLAGAIRDRFLNDRKILSIKEQKLLQKGILNQSPSVTPRAELRSEASQVVIQGQPLEIPPQTKVVVLDFDGTVVNSLKNVMEAWRIVGARMLKEESADYIPANPDDGKEILEYVLKTGGGSLYDQTEHFVQTFKAQGRTNLRTAEEYAHEFSELVVKGAKEQNRNEAILPRSLEFLRELKRRGFKGKVIQTSGQAHEALTQLVELFGLGDLIDEVHGARPKTLKIFWWNIFVRMMEFLGLGFLVDEITGTHPIIRTLPRDKEEVMRALIAKGYQPNEITIFGDGFGDITAGKAVGANIVGVLSEHAEPEKLIQAGAHFVVNTLEGIHPAIIEHLGMKFNRAELRSDPGTISSSGPTAPRGELPSAREELRAVRSSLPIALRTARLANPTASLAGLPSDASRPRAELPQENVIPAIFRQGSPTKAFGDDNLPTASRGELRKRELSSDKKANLTAIRESKEMLIELLKKPRNFDWKKHEAELPRLAGHYLGKVNKKGTILLTPYSQFPFLWKFHDIAEGGWDAYIVHTHAASNYYEIEVELRKQGEEPIRRVFQLGSFEREIKGVGEQKEKTKQILEIHSRLGAVALSELVRKPFNYDWEANAGFLPDLAGLELGETNGGGNISFSPYPYFAFSLYGLGKEEAGWRARIVRSAVKFGYYEFQVEFSKKGQEPRYETYQIGTRTRELKHALEEATRPVLDISRGPALDVLSRLVNYPVDYDWEKHAGEIPDVRGLLLGETNKSGGYSFSPNSYQHFEWSVLGRQQPGWMGRILWGRVRYGYYEFEVELTKDGKKPVRRIFQIGKYQRSLFRYINGQSEAHPVLDIRDDFGLKEVQELVKKPADFGWEKHAGDLPNLVGLRLGKTNRYGAIEFFPYPNFSFMWRVLKKLEAGWYAQITRNKAYPHYFEIEVELTKEGKPPIRRVFQMGPFAKKLYEHKKITGDTKEVFDINDQLGRRAVEEFLVQGDIGGANDLSVFEGLSLGRTIKRGVINLWPKSNYRYAWAALGFLESGWEGVIHAVYQMDKGIVFIVKFTKKNESPLYRVFRTGVFPKYLKHESRPEAEPQIKVGAIESFQRIQDLMEGGANLPRKRHWVSARGDYDYEDTAPSPSQIAMLADVLAAIETIVNGMDGEMRQILIRTISEGPEAVADETALTPEVLAELQKTWGSYTERKKAWFERGGEYSSPAVVRSELRQGNVIPASFGEAALLRGKRGSEIPTFVGMTSGEGEPHQTEAVPHPSLREGRKADDAIPASLVGGLEIASPAVRDDKNPSGFRAELRSESGTRRFSAVPFGSGRGAEAEVKVVPQEDKRPLIVRGLPRKILSQLKPKRLQYWEEARRAATLIYTEAIEKGVEPVITSNAIISKGGISRVQLDGLRKELKRSFGLDWERLGIQKQQVTDQRSDLLRRAIRQIREHKPFGRISYPELLREAIPFGLKMNQWSALAKWLERNPEILKLMEPVTDTDAVLILLRMETEKGKPPEELIKMTHRQMARLIGISEDAWSLRRKRYQTRTGQEFNFRGLIQQVIRETTGREDDSGEPNQTVGVPSESISKPEKPMNVISKERNDLSQGDIQTITLIFDDEHAELILKHGKMLTIKWNSRLAGDFNNVRAVLYETLKLGDYPGLFDQDYEIYLDGEQASFPSFQDSNFGNFDHANIFSEPWDGMVIRVGPRKASWIVDDDSDRGDDAEAVGVLEEESPVSIEPDSQDRYELRKSARTVSSQKRMVMVDFKDMAKFSPEQIEEVLALPSLENQNVKQVEIYGASLSENMDFYRQLEGLIAQWEKLYPDLKGAIRLTNQSFSQVMADNAQNHQGPVLYLFKDVPGNLSQISEWDLTGKVIPIRYSRAGQGIQGAGALTYTNRLAENLFGLSKQTADLLRDNLPEGIIYRQNYFEVTESSRRAEWQNLSRQMNLVLVIAQAA